MRPCACRPGLVPRSFLPSLQINDARSHHIQKLLILSLRRPAAQAYCDGSPGISITGRISTVPCCAPGMRAAMPIAASRSLASIRK